MNPRILTSLTLALVLAATSWASQSQQTNNRQVEGMVFDSQGLPISGARVTLTERQGSIRKGTVTTTERFRLDGLSAAVYDVLV